MLPFLVSRIGQGLIVMLLASLLIFSVLRLIPGDPAQVLAGRDATPEQVEQVRRQIGLDRPAWEQYATWLSGAVRGDFGRSFSRTVEVGTLLRAALLPSAELALAGFLFMVVVGVPLGIFAGLKPGGFPDYIATGFTMVTLGIPNFVFGLLLIWVLAVHFDLLPITGRVAINENPIEGLKFLVMPTIAIGVGPAAILARFVRSSLMEALNQDYVRTARAKGLRERTVVLRHAMRNALIPVITVIALEIGWLISGAVIVEIVFVRPGFGTLIISGVQFRDYQLIQGMLVVLVTVFVTANVVADIAYGFVDPRIRVS